MNRLRDFARNRRRALKRFRAAILRKLGFINGNWRNDLRAELQFWDWALKNKGRNWDPGEWRNCTNPNLELQEELKTLIDAEPGTRVRILDVGSGPLTRVGKIWPGRTVEIVPTDPLAIEYNAILTTHQIQPLVAAVFAHGEKLTEQFGFNTFDLSYASNSLDHTYDPLLVVDQMLAVTKPEHHVYLWHVKNEGARECYIGLHQWNFDIVNGELVIGDGRKARSLTALFQHRADIKCEFQRAFDTDIVVATLRKKA